MVRQRASFVFRPSSFVPTHAEISAEPYYWNLQPVIESSVHARCRDLIASCDAALGWSLDEPARERYAAAVAPLLAGAPEALWPKLAANYHADHPTVAALADAAHAGHDGAWSRWCAQAIGVLRRTGRDRSPDGVLDVDDLAQVARAALVEALPSYSYRSRFSTWAFSVIERAARDQLRAAGALRRSGHTVPIDHAADAGDLVDGGAPPEQAARARLLAERVSATLAAHPDRRLVAIFHLWAVEERTSAEIGAVVRLHESRVRALLKLARELLRADPAIQAWNEAEL